MAAEGIMADDLKKIIREQAHGLGFDAVGFADAEADPKDARALSRFLADGRQGDMGWLNNDDGRRGDPKALMPEAKTVIVLGANYGPREDPLAVLSRADRGAISVYAQGRDYHHVLKKKCKRLGRWIADNHGAGIKVFVDTAATLGNRFIIESPCCFSLEHFPPRLTRSDAWSARRTVRRPAKRDAAPWHPGGTGVSPGNPGGERDNTADARRPASLGDRPFRAEAASSPLTVVPLRSAAPSWPRPEMDLSE